MLTHIANLSRKMWNKWSNLHILLFVLLLSKECNYCLNLSILHYLCYFYAKCVNVGQIYTYCVLKSFCIYNILSPIRFCRDLCFFCGNCMGPKLWSRNLFHKYDVCLHGFKQHPPKRGIEKRGWMFRTSPPHDYPDSPFSLKLIKK